MGKNDVLLTNTYFRFFFNWGGGIGMKEKLEIRGQMRNLKIHQKPMPDEKDHKIIMLHQILIGYKYISYAYNTNYQFFHL